MRIRSFDPVAHTLTLVRGNTTTITFDDLDDDWTSATNIKLGIRKAGVKDEAALQKIAGVVVSAHAVSITLPANFGISPALEAGSGIYEWDVTGKLATGNVATIVAISPLIIKDRIAQVT